MPSFPPPRPPAPAPASPPYGLAIPAFPFPALARLAGQAQLGETRETVLACLVAARLVLATLPPYRLQPDQRRSRSAAALAWLSALAVPAPVRPALTALYEATTDGAPSVGPMLDALRDALRAAPPGALDAASAAELDRLALAVAEAVTTIVSDAARSEATRPDEPRPNAPDSDAPDSGASR
ncbi:MAG: hypothetical protein ACYC2G_16995 [Gemmatimonadaceae bacterium]